MMTEENPDPKNPVGGDDNSAEPLSELSEENDADNDIHAVKETPSEENKQQDGDDAVHKNYKSASDHIHENDEKDADDLIHGK